MYMSKEDFEKIKSRHSTTIVVQDDIHEAFAFVQEVLEAEASAMKEKCSYAVRSISDTEVAAREVIFISDEVDNEAFGDEE